MHVPLKRGAQALAIRSVAMTWRRGGTPRLVRRKVQALPVMVGGGQARHLGTRGIGIMVAPRCSVFLGPSQAIDKAHLLFPPLDRRSGIQQTVETGLHHTDPSADTDRLQLTIADQAAN